jgi:hypothetical protein
LPKDNQEILHRLAKPYRLAELLDAIAAGLEKAHGEFLDLRSTDVGVTCSSWVEARTLARRTAGCFLAPT